MTTYPAATLKSTYGGSSFAHTVPNVSKTWPASFDWALLSMRMLGVSLFFKHGTEKLIFFHVDRFAYRLNIGPLHFSHIPDFYIAMLSDAIFSALVAIGIGTRWAALFCFCNVLVAWGAAKHWAYFGFGLKADHGELIFMYLVGFATLAIMGPGRFSLDWKLGAEGFWPFQRRGLNGIWPFQRTSSK